MRGRERYRSHRASRFTSGSQLGAPLTCPGSSHGRIQALARRSDPGIADALQWVAAADEDAGVSQAAIEALGDSSSPGAVEALIELAADRGRREKTASQLWQELLPGPSTDWLSG
jgi:hypothetical protein